MLTVTLTSDFGYQDHMVALAKGQLLQHLNEYPQFIDVSHNVQNQDLTQAAHFIENVVNNFIPHVFHCVFVDLFENNNKHILCFEINKQYVLCPDNGFVNLLIDTNTIKVYKVPLEDGMPLSVANYTQTMARCINWIASGETIDDIGVPSTDFIVKNKLQPYVTEDSIDGHIVHIDRFENVVTNISRSLFNEVKKNRKFKINFLRSETISAISDTYADVPVSQKLALFNSSDLLEIAINQGNAAGLFGLISQSTLKKEAPFNSKRNTFYLQVRVVFYE